MSEGDRMPVIRRWRVYCTQFASCRWAGYRSGTAESVLVKPCPKCGREVAR